MLFTEKDIQRILENVDLATAKLVAKVLGKSFLSKADLDLLKRKGVDLVRLLPKFPTHYQSFVFGKLSAALGVKDVATINYPAFVKFLSNMGDFEPKQADLEFYRVAANKTFTHIKGLGERIKTDIRACISAEELAYLQAEREAKANEELKQELLAGVYEKRTVSKISSNLSEKLSDWNRDWGRIVETESQDVYNVGKAQQMMQANPTKDPTVYFDVFPGACRHCIKLYLTHGIGSKPRTFKLSQILENGTNYGLKSKDWRPTIHPVHPFCRCELRYVPDGYVWDDEAGAFVPPKNYEPKVKRTSKVKITIGDKEYLA